MLFRSSVDFPQDGGLGLHVKFPLRRGTVPRPPETSSARRRVTNGEPVTTVWGMEQDNNRQTDTEVAESAAAESDVIEELLVEEISIDGMCGVY